ncbi:MAG: manganese efflux pump [Oscillospiraceae bacterium]|nr:manganese efflux pump [Oscillospiraceae bacterium]
MGLIEVIMIAFGLAMDAFAVSVCKGLAMTRVRVRDALIVGLWFGGFQALMPAIGYLLGSRFSSYIEAFDHWIAFGLLLLIGLNMIKESFEKDSEEGCDCKAASVAPRAMIIPAIATSIDALAIGVAFAVVKGNGTGTPIGASVAIIGIVTLIISAIGVKIGGIFGSRFKHYAERSGGIILIIIGIKIVLEHLGVLTF